MQFMKLDIAILEYFITQIRGRDELILRPRASGSQVLMGVGELSQAPVGLLA